MSGYNILPIMYIQKVKRSNKKTTGSVLNCTPKVGHHQQKGVQFFMTKYSKERKIAAIKAVEAGDSVAYIAKEHQISETVLKWLVRSYREHGEKGLHNHTYSWTAKQKYEVLKYMQENQLSFTKTGVLLGIGPSTILNWEKRYLENGISGLEDKKKAENQEHQSPNYRRPGWKSWKKKT